MKLTLTVKCDIKGVSRQKLEDELWDALSDEIDGHISDTYFIEDENGNEKEIVINVELIEIVQPEA